MMVPVTTIDKPQILEYLDRQQKKSESYLNIVEEFSSWTHWEKKIVYFKHVELV